MRTAHKITKLLAGMPHDQKEDAAQFGDLYNQRALDASLAIHAAAQGELVQRRTAPKLRKQDAALRDAAWKLTAGIILEAFEKRDGSFLRAMADAIEHLHDPIDPVRNFILTQFGGAKAFGKRMPTIPELRAGLKRLGLSHDYRQVSRICKEDVEVKASPAPRGGRRTKIK